MLMPDRQKTWSELTPTAAQVLICDLQEEIVARSKTTPPKDLAQSADVLAQIAGLFGLPVTLSVVPEADKDPHLIAPLRELPSGGAQFLRASATQFSDPATCEHLASQGRRTLIVAGFSTEVVVLHAAFNALQQGYGVIVAVDACGGMSERTETAALTQIREFGGIVSSVVSVATALSLDFTTPQGKRVFQTLQTLRLA